MDVNVDLSEKESAHFESRPNFVIDFPMPTAVPLISKTIRKALNPLGKSLESKTVSIRVSDLSV